MTDPLNFGDPTPGYGSGAIRGLSEDKVLVITIYVLYLLGFATGWLTTIAGVIMAYALKGRAGELALSHYVFQVRTFWISLAWLVVAGVVLVIGLPLSLFLIGVPLVIAAGLIMAVAAIWFAVRCVLGLVAALADKPYDRPRAWIV